MRLNKNTLRSLDIEIQLVVKLVSMAFSMQIDESTVRDSESLFLIYVGYILIRVNLLRQCNSANH